MKVILKLAVHGIAAIAALASCSKEQKEQPVSSQPGMKTDLLGTWKQIYENDEYCLTNLCSVKTFFADGEYIYFNRVDGKWKISTDEDNEYNVHGDWFTTRWRPEAGADFNYECWDIDYMKHRKVIKIILNFLSKTLNQTCTK